MEDLAVGDFQQMSFIDEINDNDRGDTASVCSSISAGLASSKSTRDEVNSIPIMHNF